MTASTATVDLDAIRHNIRTLAGAAGGAMVCAVVKADGYGHGSVPVARAALDAGAAWLAVAQVGEARVLRAAGIEAPVLLLTEPRPDELEAAFALGLRIVVYRSETIDAIAARAAELGVATVPCHLQVDTGMRRVGCEPDEAVDRARQIAGAGRLTLEGSMTHLARADEPDDPTTDHQLDRFEQVLSDLRAAGIDPGIRHAANSAGTLTSERSRYDLVRVGIATYGIPPAPALGGVADLRPALRWHSTVSFVKPVRAGEKVSYGHHHTFERDTVVATVPVGYADGLRRRLGLSGGALLVGGRRRPIVGVVTMDQCMVDCGPDADVSVGDEVVLLGRQGEEEITANEVGELLGTIGYEVVCAIGARVERRPR
jgi:alanine racemase